MARIWWKKLTVLPPSNGLDAPATPDLRRWEAMADRLFGRGLFVFAADFYAQALAADTEKRFVPSNRFRYRYLATLLGFVGPQGRTAHMNWCRSVAWSLAQWFCRRNGSAAHILGCYVDSHFYLLREVYFNSFPGMYRVVFAWMDGPAGRIAWCWRRHRAKLHPPPNPSPSGPSSIPRKGSKKPTRRVVSPSRQPRIQPRTGLCKKVSAPSSTYPSPTTRKLRIVTTKSDHKSNRCKTEKNQQPQSLSTSGSNNNAPSIVENQQLQDKSAIEKRHAAKKEPNEFYENSPTKRKLTVVKRLRTKRPSADLTVERPSSAGAEDVSRDEEKNITRSSSTSLLDVYPLQLPRTEDFVATCGRAPGSADLDLNEVGEFARLAHYRARVLAGTHAPVNNLDTAQVKPQWLQDLERAATLIETHQQRNLASGKVVVEGDSVAHLSEIHTRLVLMITMLCRQYTRDFGETSFTRRLRGLARKLVEWKFTRITEVVAALNDVKSIATQEEKQRNLEFYHVHRA
ncbi:hypothetical protein PHYPSEUDO_005588 [Phytophthora pseudosyringae]|uniref:Uncharacterized protein n=1 Tax=Phytophthora pseudosyringae TaxID=221518 RepID=A0A8T1WC44_9STRA|nr:hypothetical protein PHYPSEUDO_005588 [Phytophthora pseudosyringae]